MYQRLCEDRVRDALADTRVVLVAGPRQAGKTTLAQRIADEAIPFRTLDDATTLAAARADPVGFVRGLDRAVIDEIQRAPELLLAIKASVDADPRPGRFLLTGSANLMTIPTVADSLAGRMETIRLLPLAQAELRGRRPGFLRAAFGGDAPAIGDLVLGDELVEMVLSGGYPEALIRRRWSRRQGWYLDYVDAIVQRDVREVVQVERLAQVPRLLRVLAARSGQLVNHSGTGAALGLNHVTTAKYTDVFESLFLLRTLPPWHTNALKRLVKTPKLHFLDAGLLAALQDVSPERLARDRTPFGPILETFVVGEVLKLAGVEDERFALSHYRDKEGREVDVVIEDRRGRVVGVEVKASATVRTEDFAGLRRLAEACGDHFAMGLLLHDHDQVTAFGERLAAVPLSALWG